MRYFPRAYLDLTQQQKISSCYHNDVGARRLPRRLPAAGGLCGRRPFVKVWCEQEGERFSAVWFNAPYVQQQPARGGGVPLLRPGEQPMRHGRPSMVNPPSSRANERPLEGHRARVQPEGHAHPARGARRRARGAAPCPDRLCDPALPRQKYALTPLARRTAASTRPPRRRRRRGVRAHRAGRVFPAHHRLPLLQGGKEDARAFRYTCTAADVAAFAARFPFPFTAGQKKAVSEILENCRAPAPHEQAAAGGRRHAARRRWRCAGCTWRPKAAIRRRCSRPPRCSPRRTSRSCSAICPNTTSFSSPAPRPRRKSGRSSARSRRGRRPSSAARTPSCRRTCSPHRSPSACATSSTASAWRSAAR